MIGVYLDPSTNKYTKQIKFALEYFLNMAGYSWKYLDEVVEPRGNDLILFYSATLPDKVYLDFMNENHSFLFIPFDKGFYVPGFYSGENLKANIRTFRFEINLPIISSQRITNMPIQLVEENGFKYGVFLFDIIGNVFYHLADDDRAHLKSKDKKNNLILEELGFNDYSQIPYINYYLEIFFMTIKEIIQFKKQWTLRRCLWPANQQFATMISHNVDSLEKWNFFSIFFSLFESIWLFITFRWGRLCKNLWGILKYIFTNVEEYWNFYDISIIEKKHKFVSTFFLGVNRSKKSIFDYEFDEPETLKELHELTNLGSEVALLYHSKQKSAEEMKKFMDALSSKCKVRKTGIRHIDFFGDVEQLDRYHQDLALKYDSSRRFPDKNAFYNGFALPYPVYVRDSFNQNQSVYQLPVSFSDKLLKKNRYKNIPFNDAVEAAKSMLKIVTRAKGLFHLQMTNSLFTDIPYMPKFLDYCVDYLKNNNAFVTTCSGMIDWIEKRNLIDIDERENKIVIHFKTAIDQITFEVIGNRVITSVFGGNNSFKKNIVQFINVIADLEVEINLVSIDID